MLAYLFVIVRLSLIYPAVSLGSRLTLPTAWKDSRGHFWNIAGMGFVAYLPLLLIWIIALLAGGKTLLLASFCRALSWLMSRRRSSARCSSYFPAAVMSWLYRRYANGLLEHVA